MRAFVRPAGVLMAVLFVAAGCANDQSLEGSTNAPTTNSTTATTVDGSEGATNSTDTTMADPDRELTQVRFHFDWVPTSGDVPILAAQELGLFDAAGLDVATTPGGPEINCLQLVAAGEQDICIAPAVGVVTSFPTGVPITAIGLIQQRNPYGLIVSPEAGIQSPKDLEGHTVGVHPFDPQYSLWKAFEEAQGIDSTSIEEVTVSFGPEPLYAGDVDAIPNFLSLLPALVEEHYQEPPVTFLFADHGAWAAGQAIIVNNSFAGSNPDAVTAFVDAYAAGMQWALENPVEAIDLVVSSYDLEPDIVELELPALMQYWESELTNANGLLWMESSIWQRTQDMLLEFGFLSEQYDVSAVFTTDYLD